MDKQALLLQINNQCNEVQNLIAINCDDDDNSKLIDELMTLQSMLNSFLFPEK